MMLSRNGVKLHYELCGEGEQTLVFIHGWLTSGELWRYQVAEFQKDYRILTFDLRGFARSDTPDVEYTFALFADDLRWMLNELGITKPVLIGWSKGVSIAIVYASKHPDDVAGLVLIGGGPKFVNVEDFTHGITQDTFDEMVAEFEADYRASAHNFVEVCMPESDDETLKTWLHDMALLTPPWVALNSIRNDSREDLRPLLSKVLVQTLIVCGTEDTICPPASSEYMRDHMANASLHLFDGLGHSPYLTDVAGFNSLLRDYLADINHD